MIQILFWFLGGVVFLLLFGKFYGPELYLNSQKLSLIALLRNHDGKKFLHELVGEDRKKLESYLLGLSRAYAWYVRNNYANYIQNYYPGIRDISFKSPEEIMRIYTVHRLYERIRATH